MSAKQAFLQDQLHGAKTEIAVLRTQLDEAVALLRRFSQTTCRIGLLDHGIMTDGLYDELATTDDNALAFLARIDKDGAL